MITEVASVERASTYKTAPSEAAMADGSPGYEFVFTVGPMKLNMTDGTTIDVPAETPGGNACIELLSPDDRVALTGRPQPTDEEVLRNIFPATRTCVIIAGLADDRQTAEWFQVLTVSPDGLAEVGYPLDHDGQTVLTSQGLMFLFDGALSATCGTAVSLTDLIERDAMPIAVLDIATERIRMVECLTKE